MGFLLFVTAINLFWILTIINYFLVENKKGYFKDSAMRLDIYANCEFRTLWNTVLIVPQGYKFGQPNETMSSVLGTNQLLGALTTTGKVLVCILDQIEHNHCINAISNNTIKMNNLNQPTPKINTLFWKIATLIYFIVMYANAHFEVIHNLGLSLVVENRIKEIGAFVYALFTFYNFNQVQKKTE